jgi:RNA polymerase sigma-70 factor (ECF subfamily)
MTTPERALVQALAAGDERAFNEVVGRYHRSLVRLARSYVRSEAVAEEVAQDSWCAVVTGVERFEGRSSFKTWLFSIVVNKARTRAERERRTTPFSALATTGEDGSPAAIEDRFAPDGAWSAPPRAWDEPERRAVSLELREELRVALRELPERQRLVVTLRDVEGLDPGEVCELLGLSPGNERVLLHRGRTRLRAELERAMDSTAPARSQAVRAAAVLGTSSAAPIAPPRSPSAARRTAGGRWSANRCGIIASRMRST